MIDSLLSMCGVGKKMDYSSGNEVIDADAIGLSHVGTAAYDVLRKKHNYYHHSQWNVTSGAMVGEVHQTPTDAFSIERDEHPEGHSDWFPEKMAEIVSRTKIWCDVMSLGPPDGKFLEHLNEALKTIATRAKESSDGNEAIEPVIVRFLFGNIVGMPVNCNKVIEKLMEGLDIAEYGAYLQVWVGAWRRGVSWNHAKLIAVDGMYLHTGGHNLWDPHYLKNDPVHDLSLEMKGKVTHDGHYFANQQWAFIAKRQSTIIGQCIDRVPDYVPLLWKTRVTVSEWPDKVAAEFPPTYSKRMIAKYDSSDLLTDASEQLVPIISVGRQGVMLDKANFAKARPADDAFIAMINSAQTIIRCGLQDLGPVCVPGTKMALPGCTWPKNYLNAIGRAIWERGVDVEIVLSNPSSIPGNLSPTEANYGNGWTCVDVAAEIIRTIPEQFPDAVDSDVRQKVEENLRVCFIKHKVGGTSYNSGMTMGMHAKHFIVDDVCTYIGSQNLYVCDLAEWGVIIDHKEQVQAIMEQYWNPMWACSYTDTDVDVQEVMDGLEIDRNGEQQSTTFFSGNTSEGNQHMSKAVKAETCAGNSEFYTVDDDDEV